MCLVVPHLDLMFILQDSCIFLSLRGLPVNHSVGTGGDARMTAALLFGHCNLAEDLEAIKNPTLGDGRTLARKSRLGVELSNTPNGSTASRDWGTLEPGPVLWCLSSQQDIPQDRFSSPDLTKQLNITQCQDSKLLTLLFDWVIKVWFKSLRVAKNSLISVFVHREMITMNKSLKVFLRC